MNISLCYNILKKIISIEGEDNRHNYFTYQIPRKKIANESIAAVI